MKTVINENTLKKIVYEASLSLLKEQLKNQMSFGIQGNIPLKNANELCKDVNPQVLAKCDDGSRSIDKKKVGDPQYFGNTEIWRVYQQYSAAITRRSDLGRTAVSFFVFLNKVRHGWKGSPLEYYESNGNYLLGIRKAGVFLCVYFAPKNVGLGMFKFIKEVCEYNNVVFAVTDDMADMLERLGCPKYDGTVTAKFRGHEAEKKIYGSTQEAAETGAKLVGLMGKSGDVNKNLQNIIDQNPKLASMLSKNPKELSKIMSQPIVLKALMNNPKLVDEFIANPQKIQQFINNPLKLLFGALRESNPKYTKTFISEIKENKKRKNGNKLQ